MNELLERINKTSCRLLGFNASQDFTARIETVDMHCHLDFADDACAIAREAQRYGIGFFSGTVTPEGYEQAIAKTFEWDLAFTRGGSLKHL